MSGPGSGYTSDGDRVDLEVLVIQLFELLTIGLSTSAVEAKSFLGAKQIITTIMSKVTLNSLSWMQYFNLPQKLQVGIFHWEGRFTFNPILLLSFDSQEVTWAS